MLISIDHGNSAIKTVNHSFISGLSEHTVKPPSMMKFWNMMVATGRSAVKELHI